MKSCLYMAQQRRLLNIESDAPALCIFNFLHVTDAQNFFRSLMTVALNMSFVPTGCIGLLQPLDISVNDPYQQHLKQLLSNWYAQKVKDCLESGDAVENIHVDWNTSKMKPTQFHLLIENHNWLDEQDSALIH